MTAQEKDRQAYRVAYAVKHDRFDKFKQAVCLDGDAALAKWNECKAIWARSKVAA